MITTTEMTESQLETKTQTNQEEKQESHKILLKVDHVSKKYGKKISIFGKQINKRVTGVENISFSVYKGEIFGFLGPNGAGKTTTIRSILNYLKIQSGSITVLDLNHKTDALRIREHISYVPGDVSLFDNYTGNELLNFFNNFRRHDEAFLNELKNTFRVDLSKKIKSLSKGNRQQVALIAALASRPQLLILDEPTSGLDPLMSDKFHKLLIELKEHGTTILLSSHDLAEVQAICDRVGIIKNGKMILVEDIPNLKSKFLQNVTIKFSSSNIPSIQDLMSLNSILDISELKNHIYSLKINENLNEFLRFIAKFDVEQLKIEESSLEEIFLQYYE